MFSITISAIISSPENKVISIISLSWGSLCTTILLHLWIPSPNSSSHFLPVPTQVARFNTSKSALAPPIASSKPHLFRLICKVLHPLERDSGYCPARREARPAGLVSGGICPDGLPVRMFRGVCPETTPPPQSLGWDKLEQWRRRRM